MVLMWVGMLYIKYVLIFFLYWCLGVKIVSFGVKMGIVFFYINYKVDIIEVMCFSGGVKVEEGDMMFIDGLLVL